MLALSNTSQIKRTRWLQAQEYERGFWQRLGASIEDGSTSQLEWYKWRASQLEQLLARVPGGRPTGRVLEIGSGPIGIVNFLHWGERYAIDPLEGFYRQRPALIKLRNPGSTYLEGSGERLPLADGSCALVIIDNVIDHTFAPALILQEIARVLEPHGRLYLSVNVHTRWGAFLHNLLAVLRIDKGHPYTFTSPALQRFLAGHGFSIRLQEIGDYRQARTMDRLSQRLTDRIKGYIGISEFQHLVVCSKADATVV
jgi:SAM-dependent methyltransferase